MGFKSVRQKIGRFDQVRIITTRNVNYLSAPLGAETNPSGVWSVVAVLNDQELLCARNSMLIKIPIGDVLKIAGYNVEMITKNLGKLSNGQSQNEDNEDNRDV